jgi:hypothetical protein
MATKSQIVIFDAANHKHVILAEGDKLDRSILDLAVGNASYDPGTGNLSLTFSDGASVVVNLGTLAADKFLAGSSYDPASHILTLTMSDGSTYTVPLSDLIPVQVANTATATTSGDGTVGSPIKVDVKVSASGGNQLSASDDGLFVPPLDLAQTQPLIAADNGSVTTRSISNSGGPADVLLGDPAGWATIYVEGNQVVIPYWTHPAS